MIRTDGSGGFTAVAALRPRGFLATVAASARVAGADLRTWLSRFCDVRAQVKGGAGSLGRLRCRQPGHAVQVAHNLMFSQNIRFARCQ